MQVLAMDFSSNKLHGPLPDTIPGYELINLGSNNFDSSLPSSWGEYLPVGLSLHSVTRLLTHSREGILH